MGLSEMAMLFADSSLAAGIPIGIPMGIPIGLGMGESSARKKIKAQLAEALENGEIQIADQSGKPISVDLLFEKLGK